MDTREWLETDGLGGFASGTVSGIRTRRYHALLLVSKTPPTDRFVLVNGFEAWVETPEGSHPITSQRYVPDVVHPDGMSRIRSFEAEPWPAWKFDLGKGRTLEQEIFAVKGSAQVALSWRVRGSAAGWRLFVRPLISGRDYHSLHHENPSFRFDPEESGGLLRWRPYDGVPSIAVVANGEYRHEPLWYRNFLYEEERTRGLDFAEDLASPGVFRFDLSKGPATWVLGAEIATTNFEEIRRAETNRRRQLRTPQLRAADAYLVRRGGGSTIVAGYPWFADWGRDTFIALRGLCLATGRLAEARDILLEWTGAVSEGMLPNRFLDRGEAPEFNSVDASLWYAIAVQDFLEEAKRRRLHVPPEDAKRLRSAVQAILEGYARGARFGIALDSDGLLRAGEPGVQLTWMDAKVDGRVLTPRIGKPVEVECLWLNALSGASDADARWRNLFERGLAAFRERFWNEVEGCLFDVVDADHRPGAVDASVRPNQIFAVGGLPLALLEGPRARAVVDVVERRLWTPMGLRSLAPGSSGYSPHYEGGVRERDGAYHQGTVWPWLTGAFVEAWLRVRGDALEAKRAARERFLGPLERHLAEAGIGHVSEIADADPPHTPRGCPFQAWSLGEVMRLSLGPLPEASSETLTTSVPRGRR